MVVWQSIKGRMDVLKVDYNLKGKVAIVTGGGGGLGAAISEVFAQEGVNVIIADIMAEEKISQVADSLTKQYGTKAIAVRCDITSDQETDLLFAKGQEIFGKVDILVNSAGVWPTAYVKDMQIVDFERTLKINLEGPFILSKKMVNHLLERNSAGKIINVVSQAAFQGSTTGHAHYAASKAGLVGFTISLAREVAKYGINVTAVAPGIMRTPMIEKELEDPQKLQYYKNRIPIGRVSEPIEIAYSVAFLASDKGDYITGATIDVSGGMLMR